MPHETDSHHAATSQVKWGVAPPHDRRLRLWRASVSGGFAREGLAISPKRVMACLSYHMENPRLESERSRTLAIELQ